MTPDAAAPFRRRILVLGGTGLLGQACVDDLQRDPTCLVDHTDRQAAQDDWRIEVRHDLERLWALLHRRRYDLIVNGIGVLRGAMAGDDPDPIREAVWVNAVFPHELVAHAAAAGSRVVHVSTDAVFQGRTHAPYDEASAPAPADAYGASKWLGEPRSRSALTVRCSIVGHHRTRPAGLIDWFRALPPGERVPGFTDYRWTPATTLQVARLMRRLADPDRFDRLRMLSPVLHFAPNRPISKWEMLDMLGAFRQWDVCVEPALHPAGPVDLTLTTRFEAVRELSAEPRPWPAVLSEVWP